MAEPTEAGTSTVILSRDGPVDAARDEALLRQVGGVLGLPEPLVRPTGMDRPEFRLAEGVSRATADRLAAVALKAGYTPRVRDRLSIKWSSERGSLGFAVPFFVLSLLFVPMAAVIDGLAVYVSPLAVLPATALLVLAYVAVVLVALRWQFSRLYLPLVVPRAQLVEGLDAPVAIRDNDRLAAPIADARAAVRALEASLGDDLPANARQDLTASIGALRNRVRALAAAGDALDTTAGSGLTALRQRRATLDGRGDEASRSELARIDAAVQSELDAVDAGERRATDIVSELIVLRRAALEARVALLAGDLRGPADAIVRLQQGVDALRGAVSSDEDQRRAEALRRAKQAQRS